MISNSTWSRLALVTVTMVVVLASPAVADYKSAVSAYQEGAYDEARREFERLAREGDDRAQYYLGVMRGEDKDVSSDSVRDRQRPTASRTPQRSSSTGSHYKTSSSQRSGWFRIFYFPARATIDGLQFFAEIVKFDALARDMDQLSRMKDNLFIGLFALLWWILIAKALLRLWAIGSGTPDRVNRRKPQRS